MPAVLTIGAALIDVFVRSDEFSLLPAADGMQLCQKYGDKIDIDEFALFLGGGAANVAVGMARRGHRAALIAELGRDVLSEMVRSSLLQEQISTDFLIREKAEKTGMSIILLALQGGRTVLVHRGASTQLEVTDVPEEALLSAHWIHLTNVYGQMGVVKEVLSHVERSQVSVSWNPGSADLAALLAGTLQAQLLSQLKYLQVNETEWQQLRPLHDVLLREVGLIAITKGKQGGEYIERGRSTSFTSPDITVVDETGAGDAFAVGVIDGLVQKKSVAESIAQGVESSLAVIGSLGAQSGLLRRQLG